MPGMQPVDTEKFKKLHSWRCRSVAIASLSRYIMYITAKLHTRTSLMVAREDWRLCTHLVARYTKTILRSGIHTTAQCISATLYMIHADAIAFSSPLPPSSILKFLLDSLCRLASTIVGTYRLPRKSGNVAYISNSQCTIQSSLWRSLHGIRIHFYQAGDEH